MHNQSSTTMVRPSPVHNCRDRDAGRLDVEGDSVDDPDVRDFSAPTARKPCQLLAPRTSKSFCCDQRAATIKIANRYLTILRSGNHRPLTVLPLDTSNAQVAGETSEDRPQPISSRHEVPALQVLMPEANPLPSLSSGPPCYNVSSVVVLCTTTVSTYNVLELLLLIFTSFRTYAGLYFWSLLITTLGVIPYNIGFLGFYFNLMVAWAGYVFDTVGWTVMVTGESVVMYSRLHLIVQNARILQWVKWMIITNATVLHIPTTVVLFAATYGSNQAKATAAWVRLERIQMTIFCTQEFILSGLYVYETVRLIKFVSMGARTRRTMWQLFSINVVIVLLDIGLLAVEYKDMLDYERTFKSVVYTIKLKLEFAILSKLIQIVGDGTNRNRLEHPDGCQYDGNTTPGSPSGSGSVGRNNSTLMRSEAVPEVKPMARTRSGINAARSSSTSSARFGWYTSPRRKSSNGVEAQHIEKVMSESKMADPEGHNWDRILEEGCQEAGRGCDSLSRVHGQLEQYKQSVHPVQNEHPVDEPDTDSLFDYAEAMRQISRSDPVK